MPITVVRRVLAALGAALLSVAFGLAPATAAGVPQDPPLGTVPDTSHVVAAGTRSVVDPQGNAWTYRFFRNLAYPCSVPEKDGSVGYFTFLLATRDSQPKTARAPLWVKVHGGGIGLFGTDGLPLPTAKEMNEETIDDLAGYIDKGLTGLVRRDRSPDQPFRVLTVSMCNHDLYGGGGQIDSLNPNLLPDGSKRQVSGLFATKAAITWVTAHVPTDDWFLHGTSAGGAGVMHIGWAMQLQGNAPAGIVTDSGLINQEAETARYQQAVCPPPSDYPDRIVALERLHPDVADPADEPDLLVSSGRLQVPVAHVWNTGDKNTCGDAKKMDCPLRAGVVRLVPATCHHTPMRQAIASRPASEHHLDLRLCVAETGAPSGTCGHHVLTAEQGLRSSVAPKDYQPVLYDWVIQRLADDPV